MRSTKTCRADPLATQKLSELRRSLGLSQIELAARMGISQPHAAKIEHQEDMHLSTLRRYLESLGGELKLVACLAGKQQEITLHEHQGQHDSP